MNVEKYTIKYDGEYSRIVLNAKEICKVINHFECENMCKRLNDILGQGFVAVKVDDLTDEIASKNFDSILIKTARIDEIINELHKKHFTRTERIIEMLEKLKGS